MSYALVLAMPKKERSPNIEVNEERHLNIRDGTRILSRGGVDIFVLFQYTEVSYTPPDLSFGYRLISFQNGGAGGEVAVLSALGFESLTFFNIATILNHTANITRHCNNRH